MNKITKNLKTKIIYFTAVFALIIILALIMGNLAILSSPEVREDQRIIKEYQELEKAYEADTQGGATPEETLDLFIVALEAGNLELASQYFTVDEQEERLDFLKKIDEVGNIPILIHELSVNYEKQDFVKDGSHYIFYFYDEPR